jgi:hypothetical protein
VAAVTTAFLNRYLKGQQVALTTLKRAADVPGVSTLTTTSSVRAASLSCPGAP